MVPLTAAAALVGFAQPVAAHSELTSSTPAANAVLTTAPSIVRVVFSDLIEPKFSKATLTVGNSSPRALRVTVDGAQLIATAPEDSRRPGAWKVAFRVVSIDGHPISGTISFTVRPASTSTSAESTPTRTTPAPSTASSPTTTATTTPRASGHQDKDPLEPRRRLIYWVEGIVGAMLLLAAGVFWARDRS